MNRKNEGTPVCSFCGRSGDEVEKLIAGPGVYICNECIEVCSNILREELKADKKKAAPHFKLPTPEEIKNTWTSTSSSRTMPNGTGRGCVQPL